MGLAFLGTGVSRGVAIGRTRLVRHGQPEIPQYVLPNYLVEQEVERFRTALGLAQRQLEGIRERIPADAPEDIAAFIDTHMLMLEDATLVAGPIELIRNRQYNAEWSLKEHQDAVVQIFDEMDDAYLRTRKDDVIHVINRIQHILLDDSARHQSLIEEDEVGRIIFADDLSPAELMLVHQQGTAALVTEHGGPMSHSAILARSLGLPMVLAVHGAQQLLRDGETVVVDGDQGVVLADLNEGELDYYRNRQSMERKRKRALSKLKKKPTVSRDGTPVTLFTNIEMPGDVAAMRKVGGAGVGLFRTEFMYLNRSTAPDEEDHFRAYRKLVRNLKGACLTIRTLDLGADKPGLYANSDSPNPALGLRAIRLCLKEPDLFVPQLRAILRASALGPVRMLIPMLTNLQEVQQVKQLLEEAKAELRRRNLPFDPQLPLGAMIEVPAAALCAAGFARELDFLSIGTNDLIQYTLATDRMDDEVSHLYDPLNPAVLMLLRGVFQAGERAAVPVTMCGEMAGDPRYTRLLLGLGLNEFSMPATALLEVKQVVTASHIGKLREQVEQFFAAPSHATDELLARLNQDLPTG